MKLEVNLNIFDFGFVILLLFLRKKLNCDIDLSTIDKIYIVVGGDHGQGTFRFPMKILYIMNNEKRHESI